MNPGRLELIVAATEIQLGPEAHGREVQELALAATLKWPSWEAPPECVQGIEIGIVPDLGPGIRPEDSSQRVWEWTSGAIAAAPTGLPVLLHLHGFADAASRLRAADLYRLASDLDSLLLDAGFPAMRLEWADALSNRPGDVAVLSSLPNLLTAPSRLTGHVRFGSTDGRVRPDLAGHLLLQLTEMHGLLGLTCRGANSGREPGIYLRSIGSFSSAACKVAAAAWTAQAAARGSALSGRPVHAEAPRFGFDIPGSNSSDLNVIMQLEHLAAGGQGGTIWV